MSDLDDLEDIAGPAGEWKPPRRRRFARNGLRMTGNHPTHCKRGHEFSSENTYVMVDGSRACKKCMRLRILCREDS